MRGLLFVITAVAVMGLAYWAYLENYETQRAIAEANSLQREIASMRESMSILKAEWAYLNRPDRLRELAALNFDRLGLFPLRPEQFGLIGQVAYPVDDSLFDVSNAIEVIGVLEEQSQ